MHNTHNAQWEKMFRMDVGHNVRRILSRKGITLRDLLRRIISNGLTGIDLEWLEKLEAGYGEDLSDSNLLALAVALGTTIEEIKPKDIDVESKVAVDTPQRGPGPPDHYEGI